MSVIGITAKHHFSYPLWDVNELKKSIILVLALALPVMAGGEKFPPITVVDVPVAAPATVCSAFGVEVGAVYIAALNDVLPGVEFPGC